VTRGTRVTPATNTAAASETGSTILSPSSLSHMQHRKPLTKVARFALILISVWLYHLSAIAGAGSWELRVCADPENAPASTQHLDGFENRIASILADELNADLTYEWTVINDSTVRQLLKRGACDVVMSVGEGAAGLLNTVAYYRVPMVFLYLSDSGVSVNSLYDEQLRELRIGAIPNSSIHAALLDLGLDGNFVGIQPDASRRGADRIRPSVDALLRGDIDVAIVAGAPASIYVRQQPDVFAVTPVQPELVPPLTPMFHLATIGVRARDEGLRDALNLALARRWEDVQGVFRELGIPLLPSTPVLASEPVEGRFRIGVIAPFPTGYPDELDDVAESAYFGARLGEDLALRGEDREGLDLQIVYASAPSVESAIRSYDRLVNFDAVDAVVTALEAGVMPRLAASAEIADVPLLNVLDGSDAIRSSTCAPTLFHVAPSDLMYVKALMGASLDAGARSVTVVDAGSAWSEELVRYVQGSLSSRGIPMQRVVVSDGPLVNVADVKAVLDAAGDAVLILLPPPAQEMLLFELQREGLGELAHGFPWAAMQTRRFYFRLGEVAPTLASTRVAGWEASLQETGADDLNLRFSSRSARAMDVTAWATYAAIEMLVEAHSERRSTGGALLELLRAVPQHSSLMKGGGLEFDPRTNQLLQPLYVVSLHPERPWSEAVSERIALASVVDVVPLAVTAPSDDDPAAPECP
jgi:mxaJ protein